MRLKSSFFEKTGLSFLQGLMVMGGLIIILNGAQVAMAQWISHGPPGGIVTRLAIDPQTPTTLYAGTLAGVYKSTDGGESWKAINGSPSIEYFGTLVIDPQTPATHCSFWPANRGSLCPHRSFLRRDERVFLHFRDDPDQSRNW